VREALFAAPLLFSKLVAYSVNRNDVCRVFRPRFDLAP
jgi:hypothetical protein